MAQVESRSFAQTLNAVPRSVLFVVLIVFSSLALFVKVVIPNKQFPPTVDFYRQLMTAPEGSTVLIQSDWTNSTRGESGAAFESIVRVLMRRNLKFAVYSAADPQAPQVARDVIKRITDEEVKQGGRKYVRWNDWVNLGYFPNAEAHNNAMAANLRAALGGRREMTPEGRMEDPINSPVLANIQSVGDFSLVLICTASNSMNIAIERLSGKSNLMGSVTGVMVPETSVYHSSGQLKGMVGGLKGSYDLETMMQFGVNTGVKGAAEVPGVDPIPGFEGKTNLARATNYYFTLHVAIGLLILAVVVGNVGMWLARLEQRRSDA